MNSSFSVYGLSTGIIHCGDSIADRVIGAAKISCGGFRDGDILVLAETAVATSEGNVIRLADIEPSARAHELAATYQMDAAVVEVVLRESDSIVGGIPHFLLCLKGGTLLPNAGVDASNAPHGCVTPLPADPDASACRIRDAVRKATGAAIGVILADSRTHAMRSGCSGVAIGCAGIPSVIDERGRSDLFGRTLEVTKRAVADNLASAAELVMGEADECMPAAIVRGTGLPVSDTYTGVESIDADECLFMGIFAKSRKQEF
ncbi:MULTISPECIES: coenzyme F420-0:L-glutamate ligase [unclassified Methanoregula]|uniref:coenzyme F420-0:L-glutamate ligase n=1 Tax=unclassified Methanoregula TaxID=2649730 RepID=UPI0009C6C349|nr:MULTISPECIES: coenzyme F420-0:L-glutamate ligase [unclassified Methanoregula]OPX64002.1 MAG: Coenzyme F420:L-glutamate ligase [Methanoregula sp. PtaB.Bin085]OPY33800.1 MAG: Coenzyme F420:L-glutamate ligase [Methanoregula sp. PtaU1.Bin006]